MQDRSGGTNVERELGCTCMIMAKCLDQGRRIVTSYRIDSRSHRFTPKVPARVLPTFKCRKASNSSRPAGVHALGNYPTQILAHLTAQRPLPPISPLDAHADLFCERFPIQELTCMRWIPRCQVGGLLERYVPQHGQDYLTPGSPQSNLGLQVKLEKWWARPGM